MSTRPIVSKLVRCTDVDWVIIPARGEKEKKEREQEWPEFWDAEEGRSEEEMVENIFCDALDHFFIGRMHRQPRDSRSVATRTLGQEGFKKEGG